MEGRSFHPDEGRRARDIAAEAHDLGLQVFAFEDLPRLTQGQAHDLAAFLPVPGGRRAGSDSGGQHVGADGVPWIARSHDQQPFDDVAQFPDVAGPVVCLHGGDGILADAPDGLPRRFRDPFHEEAGEQRDVIAPVTQRRHLNGHHVEPVVQVFAEVAVAHLQGKIAGGGGDDAHVHLDLGAAPDPLEDLFLKDTDDLALGLHGHVRHLVEEKGSVVGPFERPHLARAAAAADRALGAEQFHFHPLGLHGGAVEHHERAVGAARARVPHARDHLLSRPREPADENAAVGGRDAFDGLAHMVDGRGTADQFAVRAGAQPQLLDLAPQACRLDGAFNDQHQAVHLERFFDEVIGAELDRRHRGFHGAVAAHHHHRDAGVVFLDRFQDTQAVQFAALQPDIQENQARATGLDAGERGGAVRGLAGFVALVL